MARKLQFKRGMRSSLPTLAPGEPGWVSDEKRLYIGSVDGNIPVGPNPIKELSATADLADGDALPMYDASAAAERKTLISTVKAFFKSYFDELYAGKTHAATHGSTGADPLTPAAIGAANDKLDATTATALGLAAEATVNDALVKLNGGLKVGDIVTTVRNDLGDKYLLCNGESIDPTICPELSALLGIGVYDRYVGTNPSFPQATVYAEMAYGDGKWVIAVSDNYSTVYLYTSTDLITWSSSSFSFGSSNTIGSIRYINGTWVIIGTTGSGTYNPTRIAYTTDLTGTWTVYTPAKMYGWPSLEYYNGMWYLAGDYMNTTSSDVDASIFYAPTLYGLCTSYTRYSLGLSTYTCIPAYGMSWYKGGMILLAAQASGYINIYRSTNPSQSGSFTSVYSDTSGTTNNWLRYLYTCEQYAVAINYNGKVLSSVDGITWTPWLNYATGTYHTAIVYDGKRFIAFSQNKSSYSNQLNGTWTTVSECTYGGEKPAIGNNRIISVTRQGSNVVEHKEKSTLPTVASASTNSQGTYSFIKAKE